MMKTETRYRCFGWASMMIALLMLPLALDAKGRITIKTNKKVGNSISVKISANGDVNVTGAKGTFRNKSSVSYTLESQTVTFEGDILTFENQSSGLTSVAVSESPNLEELVVWMNEITSVDVTGAPNLTYLNVMSNKLTSLNISKNTKLSSLNFAQNKVGSINIGQSPDLVSLDCGNNQLTSLDLSKNGKLQILNCSFNKLASLDPRPMTIIKNFNCSGNQILSLDLSKNTELEILVCFLNKFNSITFPEAPNLKIVDCGLNPISNIDLSPLKSVEILDVSGCELTSLNLYDNRELKRLNAHKNKLTALNLGTNKKIRRITCYSNQIGNKAMNDFILTLRSLNNEPIDPRNAEGEIVAVDTSDPNEKNVCSKASVYEAYDRDWIVKDFRGKHANRVDYEGVDDGTTISPRAALNHTVPIGSKIKMTIFAHGPITIKGATGNFVNGEEVEYVVDMPRIVILGDISTLTAFGCKITSADLTYAKDLISLDLSVNELTKLDLSKNALLQEAKLEYNKLQELDFSGNPKLKRIYCYSNELNKLDVSKCPDLYLLSANDCKLPALDVTHNAKLEKLTCNGNPLGTINVSQNLELTALWAAMTNINQLDLSHNPKLTQVLCQFNNLSSVDLSHNPELTLFWGSGNQLNGLNFKNNGKLLEAFIYDNLISAEEMSKTIESLPTRTAQDNARIFVININSQNESNVCTKEDVRKALAKNWKVFSVSDPNAINHQEYEGGTGIEEIGYERLSIYPNPASELLTIRNAQPQARVQMTDTTGRTCFYGVVSATGELNISLDSIPEGNYLLMINDSIHRVIVAR